ncbi:sigma-54-dependent Fis family transcriptional regulator [Rhodanobacter sp. 7MK24]|uniref:sigma-54-dependent transcriptional regulator n=1 Tax=Rhodanobacter sp. 7MK24 TaxID=2775922 RepID=UPI00177EBE52|nr:sigma-54 dependent transcriptional regulator [Rhodanobacter sp. 7MK24]MBD8879341.1 sigma-54-dependent Fis family transcriptional regulator [Rhodanobacter sp. 7MK24]
MSAKRILIVDNEAKMRRILELSLKAMGHIVSEAADGAAALSIVEKQAVDLVLTDLRMPGMDGIALLAALRERGMDVPVIVMTAYGTIETAVEAMKLGAVDYIIRPFEMETVEMAVTRALAMQAVQRENSFLREEVSRGWGAFVGTSVAMQSLYELIRQVASTRSNAFIVGDTGTGKELVARAIHEASGRTGLFVPINCAAIPAELLESELFGHVKGAFTGAVRDRVGKCELASTGTIFLDEITEMPANLQVKLLRVLQEGCIERLGANGTVPVDLRIVSATNRDLQQAVESGALRRDLYFRLNVVRIDVPGLRDRRGDIALLANHFLRKHALELGRAVPSLDSHVLQRLEAYEWPGNVRELENIMERAVVLCRGEEITLAHLPVELVHQPPSRSAPPVTLVDNEGSLNLKAQVEELECRLIKSALARSANNKAAAARLLGISERTLWYKLKTYKVES